MKELLVACCALIFSTLILVLPSSASSISVMICSVMLSALAILAVLSLLYFTWARTTALEQEMFVRVALANDPLIPQSFWRRRMGIASVIMSAASSVFLVVVSASHIMYYFGSTSGCDLFSTPGRWSLYDSYVFWVDQILRGLATGVLDLIGYDAGSRLRSEAIHSKVLTIFVSLSRICMSFFVVGGFLAAFRFRKTISARAEIADRVRSALAQRSADLSVAVNDVAPLLRAVERGDQLQVGLRRELDMAYAKFAREREELASQFEHENAALRQKLVEVQNARTS